MRRWLGAALVFAAAGTAPGQQPGGGSPSPGGIGFGAGINQPLKEKDLFPDAKSILPTPGTAPVPPSWSPFSATPPGSPTELPPTLIPDGSLPAPPPVKKWTTGFELGVNGSQGNADVLSLRAGTLADYKTPRNLFHLDFLYSLTRQDGKTSQDQALLNARDEILFPHTRWGVFAATQVEYDQFRDYDFRAGNYAGVSYWWVKTNNTLFKTRLGAGAVREMSLGSRTAPDRWVPEALLGMDFNYKLGDRQAYLSSVDVYPNLSQLGQYRVRARMGYEIILDPAHGLLLRLGVQDRYDTLPGQSRRNDLNYFATLLFRF